MKRPRMKAPNPPTTDTVTYNAACMYLCVSIKCMVSNENAEKVVKPPSNPTTKNKLIICGAEPFAAKNETNAPIKKHPNKFTITTAQLPITDDIANRKTAPNAPPPATARICDVIIIIRLTNHRLSLKFFIFFTFKSAFPAKQDIAKDAYECHY